MVHPFLHLSLHTYFSHPIDCFIIRRLCYQFIDFLVGITFSGIITIRFHPISKLVMENDKFLIAIP